MTTSTPQMDATSSEPEFSFSLLDEPWIPCQLVDGSMETLGLRAVVDRMTTIRRIIGDTPLQTVTIYRLLLAITWRAHLAHGELADSTPTNWWVQHFNATNTEQPFSEFCDPVLTYLDSLSDHFNLIDPQYPFLQVPELQKPDHSFSRVDRLVADAESEYFSTRAGTGRDSLSLAEAARWLLVINAYDYAGIKPGVVDDERVKGGRSYPIGPGWAGQTGQIIIHGQNLAQSLLLNTPAGFISDCAESGEDLASWEQEEELPIPSDTEALFPNGPCNVLTWPSRRIRLHVHDGQVIGVLVTNGYKIVNKNQFMDPLTGYRYSKNQSSKTQVIFMPQEHDSEMPLWRGVHALLAREGIGMDVPKGGHPNRPAETINWLLQLHNDEILATQPVNIELFGVEYGPQQSSIVNVFTSSIPLNLAVLTEREPILARQIVDAVRGTTEASTELGRFAGNLLKAGGGDYVFNADVKHTLLHAMEAAFAQWLPGLTPDVNLAAHRLSWEQQVYRAVLSRARQLIDSAAPKALRGTIDGEGHFTSAATALGTLRMRLDVHLPQAAAARKKAAAHQVAQFTAPIDQGASEA